MKISETNLTAIILITLSIFKVLFSRRSSSSSSSFLPVNDTYRKCNHYEDTKGDLQGSSMIMQVVFCTCNTVNYNKHLSIYLSIYL